LLIDIQIKNKQIIIVGGGLLAERKVKNLLPFNPKITVLSKTFTPFLQELQNQKQLQLIEGDPLQKPDLLNQLKDATLIYAATDNKQLNSYVVEKARENKILVCAIDMPELCDFYTPATLEKGSIRVGICTDGKSPLMSKIIKNKLKTQLTEDDALHVELQHYCREIAKKEITDTANRREALYKIYYDKTINQLLRENQLESAKKKAENYLRQNQRKRL